MIIIPLYFGTIVIVTPSPLFLSWIVAIGQVICITEPETVVQQMKDRIARLCKPEKSQHHVAESQQYLVKHCVYSRR